MCNLLIIIILLLVPKLKLRVEKCAKHKPHTTKIVKYASHLLTEFADEFVAEE